MTPIHMDAHNHDIAAVGLVISLHVAAMWLPSLVTGLLVDQIGARATAVTGGVILLISGISAALAPGVSLGWMIFALVLLGIGWNLGLVSGSTLVTLGTTDENRARKQGSIDVWYQVFGATAGLGSGLVVSATSFGLFSALAGALAVMLVPLVLLRVRP